MRPSSPGMALVPPSEANADTPHAFINDTLSKSKEVKDADIPQIPERVQSPEYNPYFPNGIPKAPPKTRQSKSHEGPPLSLDGLSLESVINNATFSATTRELLEAKKQVAELEQKLRDKDENKDNVNALDKLDNNISEKRKTIAGLEAKGEITKRELRILEEARSRGASLSDSSTDLVTEFTHEVSRVKATLQAEIEPLIVQRDKIQQEIAELTKARDRAIEEISMLNIKNNQLLDLHHELHKQAIDKIGSRSQIMSKEPTKGSSDNLAGGVFSDQPMADEPLVTVLDGGDDKKDRQPGRRFWKRPTAAVAKGVKGFNKVFAPDNGTISSGPYSETEVHAEHITHVNGSSAANSANTNFPPTVKEVITRSNKGPRNGWFKQAPETAPSLSSNVSGPAAKSDSLLMGYPIEKRIQIESTTIPLIVTRCIQEVEARGMMLEGIYRKSGARSQIAAIEEAFEKSFDTADFGEVLSGDISGVTSAVKQYLRYLPTPLIHFDYYDNFVEAAKHTDQAKAVEQLRFVVNSLPAAYRDCLRFLIQHLSKVTQYSEQNLMHSRNLAVCFAPTVVRHTDGNRELLDMAPRNDGMQLMIEHYSAIFADFL